MASNTWQVPHKIVEAEKWQVGLYGSGGTKMKHQIHYLKFIKTNAGHYLPHFDAYQRNNMPSDVTVDDLWVGNRYLKK